MNLEEKKKITLSLIETFNKASQVALDLREAGLKKETADELAEAIKETQSQSLENVATKQDIQILESDILLKVGKMIYISTVLIITMIGIAVAIIKI